MPHNPLHYVVLRHEGVPAPHYDLLIDLDSIAPLLTFRCENWPPVSHIIRQPDHRRIYLTYEGPISNNRGDVRKVAQGVLNILEQTPTRLIIQLIPGPRLELSVLENK